MTPTDYARIVDAVSEMKSRKNPTEAEHLLASALAGRIAEARNRTLRRAADLLLMVSNELRRDVCPWSPEAQELPARIDQVLVDLNNLDR